MRILITVLALAGSQLAFALSARSELRHAADHVTAAAAPCGTVTVVADLTGNPSDVGGAGWPHGRFSPPPPRLALRDAPRPAAIPLPPVLGPPRVDPSPAFHPPRLS